ncbi:hypothetical protein [Saccharopolyspora spinosa]|uniref:Uncharacterized protein n=1 Tax=Saccharopolyspora spinosa TaxID=60894 RepID=A0A2N3Y194_SACSN|nr:hypothetical protein [Saccharopolyspora spinosa]PKW16714.1 hypothetical protein A8926_4585 [Saccharopolyspora spinosa]
MISLGRKNDLLITRLFVGHPGGRGVASGLCVRRASVRTVLGDLVYRSGVVVFHGHGHGYRMELFPVGRELWGDG